jgi:hypothetical protein
MPNAACALRSPIVTLLPATAPQGRHCLSWLLRVCRLASGQRPPQRPDGMLRAACTSTRALARAGHVGTFNCAVVPSPFDVAASSAAVGQRRRIVGVARQTKSVPGPARWRALVMLVPATVPAGCHRLRQAALTTAADRCCCVIKKVCHMAVRLDQLEGMRCPCWYWQLRHQVVTVSLRLR